jgi:hypothetical protein
MTNRAIINLGPYWTVFTRPRSDLQMLGTIQQGPGIGALAMDDEGEFFQVNGDVIRHLNRSRILALLVPARERFDRRSRMGGMHKYVLPEFAKTTRSTSVPFKTVSSETSEPAHHQPPMRERPQQPSHASQLHFPQGGYSAHHPRQVGNPGHSTFESQRANTRESTSGAPTLVVVKRRKVFETEN